ncbi:unnamed protein product, partial [Heterotrigona itama]
LVRPWPIEAWVVSSYISWETPPVGSRGVDGTRRLIANGSSTLREETALYSLTEHFAWDKAGATPTMFNTRKKKTGKKGNKRTLLRFEENPNTIPETHGSQPLNPPPYQHTSRQSSSWTRRPGQMPGYQRWKQCVLTTRRHSARRHHRASFSPCSSCPGPFHAFGTNVAGPRFSLIIRGKAGLLI